MNIIRVSLIDINKTNFDLGYVGEKNHTKVVINCASIFRDYPDAVATMVAKPPQGDLYPINLTKDGTTITWEVTESDIAYAGSGQYQLTFTDGTGDDAEIIKTVYGQYSIKPSLTSTGEPPEPLEDWLQEATAALETFETEIGEVNKLTTASASDVGKALSPKTVVSGKVTEWEYVNPADPEAIQEAVDEWLDDHPEATTTVEDGAITEPKLNDSLKSALAWQSDVDGLMSAIKRPEFIVGNAEEVLSDRGETDEAVYLFRKAGGTKKAYNREKVRKIVGGTVAWNQIVPNDNIHVQLSGAVSWNTFTQTSYFIPTTSGHKYLVSLNGKTVSGGQIGIRDIEHSIVYRPSVSYSLIYAPQFTSNGTSFVQGNWETGDTDAYLNVCDLTAALDSTIADYIYTLETQTAGSGVALFRSLFSKSFYQFNSGSLESVNVSEHKLTGKNLAKLSFIGIYNLTTGQPNQTSSSTYASTEKIMCNGGTDYVGSASFTITQMLVYYWDANGNYIQYDVISNSPWKFTTPSNAKYVAVTFRKSSDSSSLYDFQNVQLEFGESASAFEPYQLYEYAMPNVTLRGIPKLVNNEIVFDGDELLPDGTKVTRYAEIDMSTLTGWFYNDSLGVFGTTSFPNMLYENKPVPCICSEYVTVTENGALSTDRTITIKNGYYGSSYLIIKDSRYNNTTDFAASLSGKKLVYPVATPTTETVDGYQELQVCSRYGTEEYIDRLATAETSPRDVAIPCGHQTFYPVNVFDYIDELTKPDNNFIADANIASGKYFSVGNGLYLSTQAIAQGETIIPGTNCTAVSLADALNAINQ